MDVHTCGRSDLEQERPVWAIGGMKAQAAGPMSSQAKGASGMSSAGMEAFKPNASCDAGQGLPEDPKEPKV